MVVQFIDLSTVKDVHYVEYHALPNGKMYCGKFLCIDQSTRNPYEITCAGCLKRLLFGTPPKLKGKQIYVKSSIELMRRRVRILIKLILHDASTLNSVWSELSEFAVSDGDLFRLLVCELYITIMKKE